MKGVSMLGLENIEKPKDKDVLMKTYYCKEYWHGHSRDGAFQNIEGYHYFKLNDQGDILEAFEYYESEDGEEYVVQMLDFVGINWYQDLGYQDDELLEGVSEAEFFMISKLVR
jgi:hypothetical protein